MIIIFMCGTVGNVSLLGAGEFAWGDTSVCCNKKGT